MNEQRGTGPEPARDAGFSLVEILIVMVVLGIIMSALAAAVITTLNVAPDTDARLDDARSTRSLTTWLAHDTTSTPPFLPEQAQGGMDITTTATAGNNRCGGSGSNLLHLRWVESGHTSSTRVANYRFVVSGGEGVIVRYTCDRAGAGPYVLRTQRPVTPPLDPASPPVVTVDQPGSTVRSLTFTLTGIGGETVLVETASRNPAEFFP